MGGWQTPSRAPPSPEPRRRRPRRRCRRLPRGLGRRHHPRRRARPDHLDRGGRPHRRRCFDRVRRGRARGRSGSTCPSVCPTPAPRVRRTCLRARLGPRRASVFADAAHGRCSAAVDHAEAVRPRPGARRAGHLDPGVQPPPEDRRGRRGHRPGADRGRGRGPPRVGVRRARRRAARLHQAVGRGPRRPARPARPSVPRSAAATRRRASRERPPTTCSTPPPRRGRPGAGPRAPPSCSPTGRSTGGAYPCGSPSEPAGRTCVNGG